MRTHAEEMQPLYDRMTCCADDKNDYGYTFASYNPHICIDYIFVKKNVLIHDYKIHKIKASDHFPISAILYI